MGCVSSSRCLSAEEKGGQTIVFSLQSFCDWVLRYVNRQGTAIHRSCRHLTVLLAKWKWTRLLCTDRRTAGRERISMVETIVVEKKRDNGQTRIIEEGSHQHGLTLETRQAKFGPMQNAKRRRGVCDGKDPIYTDWSVWKEIIETRQARFVGPMHALVHPPTVNPICHKLGETFDYPPSQIGPMRDLVQWTSISFLVFVGTRR